MHDHWQQKREIDIVLQLKEVVLRVAVSKCK